MYIPVCSYGMYVTINGEIKKRKEAAGGGEARIRRNAKASVPKCRHQREEAWRRSENRSRMKTKQADKWRDNQSYQSAEMTGL